MVATGLWCKFLLQAEICRGWGIIIKIDDFWVAQETLTLSIVLSRKSNEHNRTLDPLMAYITLTAVDTNDNYILLYSNFSLRVILLIDAKKWKTYEYRNE